MSMRSRRVSTILGKLWKCSSSSCASKPNPEDDWLSNMEGAAGPHRRRSSAAFSDYREEDETSQRMEGTANTASEEDDSEYPETRPRAGTEMKDLEFTFKTEDDLARDLRLGSASTATHHTRNPSQSKSTLANRRRSSSNTSKRRHSVQSIDAADIVCVEEKVDYMEIAGADAEIAKSGSGLAGAQSMVLDEKLDHVIVLPKLLIRSVSEQIEPMHGAVSPCHINSANARLPHYNLQSLHVDVEAEEKDEVSSVKSGCSELVAEEESDVELSYNSATSRLTELTHISYQSRASRHAKLPSVDWDALAMQKMILLQEMKNIQKAKAVEQAKAGKAQEVVITSKKEVTRKPKTGGSSSTRAGGSRRRSSVSRSGSTSSTTTAGGSSKHQTANPQKVKKSKQSHQNKVRSSSKSKA